MRDGAAAIIFGTRPEVVKLAPVIWEMSRAAYLIHTGQHSLASLSEIFRDVGIDPPAVSGSIPTMPAGHQIGAAVAAVTDALMAAEPDLVIVQGDTNSTLAGALAATSLGLPLVHVEAGLRSFDRRMPEERNRVVVDHLADLLCAPTPTAVGNLRAEGIETERITMTGNTVVDAVHRCLPDAGERTALRARFGLDRDRYILATFHRPENVDEPRQLEIILDELARLPLPVVLPVHPRTADRATRGDITLGRGAITVIPPLGYRDFLGLAAESALIISDSGGVQEEASVLARPVVVVRRSTERPEVLGTVATRIEAGPEINTATRSLLAGLDEVHGRLAATESPYGDGHSAERIVAAVAALIA